MRSCASLRCIQESSSDRTDFRCIALHDDCPIMVMHATAHIELQAKMNYGHTIRRLGSVHYVDANGLACASQDMQTLLL
jgi:hypothetical protein